MIWSDHFGDFVETLIYLFFNWISILIKKISEFGACPRKPCNNGYYPIHEAAKNASSKTMEVFFQVCFYKYSDQFNCVFLYFIFRFHCCIVSKICWNIFYRFFWLCLFQLTNRCPKYVTWGYATWLLLKFSLS